MKKILFILLLPALVLQVSSKSKSPKVKLPEGVVLLTSYDKAGKVLNQGKGFFITESGDGIADYKVFENAWSVQLTDSKGKKWDVTRIYGASDMYDVVKFRSNCNNAKFYPVSSNKPSQGSSLSLTQNGKEQKVVLKEIKEYNGLSYFTLDVPADSSMMGFPVCNASGESVGIMQLSAGKDKDKGYALGMDVEKHLIINGLSAGSAALNSIHIAKVLPQDVSQAETYLFLLGKNLKDTVSYLTGLADFIQTYPDRVSGYADRAAYYASNKKFAEAEADYDAALQNVKDGADVHYNFSKLLYRLNMYKDYQQYKDWDLQRALSEAQQAQQLSPNTLYQLQIGDCFFALKKYEDAYNAYQEVNKTSSATPQTFFYAARARELFDDDSTKVLALIDSALARFSEPYHNEAGPYLLQRAQHRVKYGLFREAAMDYHKYEQLVGTQRLSDSFFYEKEQVDLQARLYPWAIEDIDKALRIRPKEYLYLVEKAMVHLRVANYDEATFAAEQALKVNAEGADAYKVLGIVNGQNGKKAEALKYLNKAKELGDTQVDEWIQNLK